MRKLKIALVLLLIPAAILLADGLTVLSTSSSIISAYKTKWIGNMPASSLELRILDYNSSEMESGSDLTMSINTRNQEFEAFSWVLGGNIYTAVSVTFTFGRMFWESDSTTTEIIPYSVKLEHVSSRIGNTAIPVGQKSNSVSPFTNDFTQYSFYYADYVSGSGVTVDVGTTESEEAVLTYDMSSKTVVKNSSGNEVTYGENVCNYWNRTGKATVKLKITSEGYKLNTTTSYSAGTYYAAIRVEVRGQ